MTVRASPGDSPFHPWSWLAWTVAALGAALLTQNPLYLTLVLLAVLWVREKVSPEAAPWNGYLRWAWVIPLFTMVANGLTIRAGESVLIVLPEWIPLIGGPVTAEVLAFGFLSGYTLVVLLVIFTTFNAATDYYRLIRLVPGFLFQAGLVTGIALTFVPQTLSALEEIREAQQIRGHRFQGWRDLPPLFLPLLTMGLERSIQLAEAMESRGFGGAERSDGQHHLRSPRLKLMLLGGLLLLVTGISLLLLSFSRLPGLVVAATGLLAIGVALRRMGRKIRRSRYRPEVWHRRDSILATVSILFLGSLLILNTLHQELFLYYPYPRLSWPPFDPWVGGTIIGLALPAILLPEQPATPNQADANEQSPVRCLPEKSDL